MGGRTRTDMNTGSAEPEEHQADHPTVSAVIPAYNAAGTIERALNSVYAQTYPSIIQVIVVDDGSADETAAIVARRFPQVTLISQGNAGSPVARNRGVEAASGEYIAFLDDDDEWLPGKTRTQMGAFAENPEAALTIASAHIEGLPEAAPPADGALQPLRFREIFPVVGFHYGCSGWVIRRDAFVAAGGFRPHLRRSQDTELLWRLALAGQSIWRVMAPLYTYYPGLRRRSPEELRAVWESWHRTMVPVVEGFCRQAASSGALSAEEARRALSRFQFSAGWQLWDAHSATLAKAALAEAARHAAPGTLTKWRCELAARSPVCYRWLRRVLRKGLTGGASRAARDH
jgi:GT2 family glycosyltransferase